MRKLLLASAASLCFVNTAAAEDGFSFGVYGGATLETDMDHRLFGGVLAPTDPSILPSGTWAAIDFRHHGGGAFWGVGVEGISINTGAPGVGTSPRRPGVDAAIVDLEYGRHLSASGYWTIGLRHMTMDVTPDSGTVGRGPLHAFEGTGLRVGYEGKTGGSEGEPSFVGGIGLSVLDGEIETSARGTWLCTACTDTDTTAVGIDGKIALAMPASDSATFMFGYQAQYWADVTVEISDVSGLSENAGTSDILVHGPFLGYSLNF